MKYYKVVDDIDKQIVIDTKQSNYSSTLNRFNSFSHFLQIVAHFSFQENIDFNTLIQLNNNLAWRGNAYLENFPKSNNGYFSVRTITNRDEDNDKLIKESTLIQFIEMIDKDGIKVFDEGFYLWEYLFEVIRFRFHTQNPSRINSFFLFESISDCKYYIDNHKMGGQICEIEIIEKKALFRGDMRILDELSLNSTYQDIIEPIDMYWKSVQSQKPIPEILFQGICRLKPLK